MFYLTLTQVDKVAIITISRPPANALSYQLIEELSALLDDIEHQNDIQAIVLHGEGRFFSAGADIKEFTQIREDNDFSKLGENGQKTFEKIESFPKPIIAAIHGAALGGGLELAMACHIRLVTEDAKLGLPELQLGIIPGFAGTQRLPRYVGVAKAAEMILTSEPISGVDAVHCGLANHVFPEDQLMEKAKEMAGKIANKSPQSIRAVIELLQTSKSLNFQESCQLELAKFKELFATEDAQEGIKAFIEKRKPHFTGK